MNKLDLIIEWVVMTTLAIIFLWGFASGSEHSWGWRLIAYYGDLFLQMKGA